MKAATARAAFALVPYALIDEPEIAARETMDPDKMLDLVESIRRLGLLQPIGLIVEGGRFRVSFGHRRLKACGAVPLDPVPAMVFPEGTPEIEAMKVAENNDREELNAGEEALYLADLLERTCEGDTDRLCAYVGRKRQFVEDRLLLLAGDVAVLEALRGRRIKFSVAKELNRVKDPGARMQFLDAATRGGATGSLVRQWREQHELFESRQGAPAVPSPDGTSYAAAQPADSVLRCHYCGSDEDTHDMRVVYIHGSCLRVEERAQSAARKQEVQS